jgi:ribosome biogenesis GTPase
MSKDKKQGPKEFIPKRWIGCDVEAEYFGDERKVGKAERKKASAKDRSKYKKTDKEKTKLLDAGKREKLESGHLLRGRVLSILSEGILVEHEGATFTCILRGSLKKEKTQAKNLVTVGDFVLFEEIAPSEGAIVNVEPRRTTLSRADNLSRRREQLIAANIDQVIITASVVSPPLKPALIDRYIIATRKGGMEPLVVINKADLLEGEQADNPTVELEKEIMEEILQSYAKVGIPVIAVSVKENQGLDELCAAMAGKSSVFSGQSGVGKSSLINAVTGSELLVSGVVERTKKGSHTTTRAHLVKLKCGGWCIDTPGIQSFGVWDLDKDEIEQYFTEIYSTGRKCHFPDCSHRGEKECAVIEAVENGTISILRYESYVNLIEGAGEQHYRR